MEKRIGQMLIGQDAPFILKSLAKSQEKKLKTPVETECSVLRILRDNITDRMHTRGFISNQNSTIPITVSPGTDIVTFSCFDEIHLFFYYMPTADVKETDSILESFMEDGKCHVFYTKICCCRKWDLTALQATEILSPSSMPHTITIQVQISNVRREDTYHYNICELPNEKLCSRMIDGRPVQLFEFQCPLCYKIFKSEVDLHIKILHPEYNLRMNGKVMTLDYNKDYIDKEIIPSISVENTPPGIEFYIEDLFDEDEPGKKEEVNYINFDVELTSSTEIGEIEPMKGQRDMKVKGKCYNTERDLVGSIFDAKSKKTLNKIMVHLLYRKPLIKDTRSNKRFKATPSFNLFSGKATANKKFTRNPVIAFMKKRRSKLIKYELENYGLLIDREFAILDYSKILSKHLNLGLKHYVSAGAITPKAYNLMNTWNRLFIENMCVKKALTELVSNYEINDDVIKFIDLLYCRGLLTSEEIMAILMTKI